MFALVKDEPGQHLYRFKSLLVNVHWNELKLEHLHTIIDACSKIVKEHGQMSSIIVMRGELNIDLSQEARRASAELTSKFDKFNTGQAIVIEADGFRASMARSVITGINLIARSRAKQRVFKDPHEATSWLCALDGQPNDIRESVPLTWPAVEKLLRDLPG